MTAVTEPSPAWRNRIVGHADVPPADLVPNPRNWRTHPKDQQRALAGALGEVGWVAEVLVNRTTGNVVDGHLRIELALERAESSVPVTYIELTDEEERLVLASWIRWRRWPASRRSVSPRCSAGSSRQTTHSALCGSKLRADS